MPAALLTRNEMLDRLMALFRAKGFDGASLADISDSTGLGKSSLYHHFPGGKEEIATEVLAHLERGLEAAMFAPMRSDEPPARKFDRMLEAIDRFYEGGRRACLLERLSASVDANRFKRPLGRAFRAWIDAVEALGVEAGVPRALARARAEDLVVRVEGALVVSSGTGDTRVFARTIRDLRARGLGDAGRH
ncbi:MAG TPA: TetR/AcrR family transcriptional regulator [Vicinamibacterales bacterium]|nr:TetR/AcrR family transcriptional regulator [Vicinamibacterales bacterium]